MYMSKRDMVTLCVFNVIVSRSKGGGREVCVPRTSRQAALSLLLELSLHRAKLNKLLEIVFLLLLLARVCVCECVCV